MAWDQSTKISAWSFFIDGEYSESGVIDLHKMSDTELRVKEMGLEICKKIGEYKPEILFIEDIQQQQGNVMTLKLLARIQGIAIGYATAHNIPIHILPPSRWRSALAFKQGAGVKRPELKAQAINYVEKNFGLTGLTDDESEAVCINSAAHKIYRL